jgi:hypothetical protein
VVCSFICKEGRKEGRKDIEGRKGRILKNMNDGE